MEMFKIVGVFLVLSHYLGLTENMEIQDTLFMTDSGGTRYTIED